MSHPKQLTGCRVVQKSTGGITPSIPEPVDLVGNAALLKSNTVAFIQTHTHIARLAAGIQSRGGARARCKTGSW